MIQRCRNKNYTHYSYYGGAGIRVCRRWAKFINFLADMGPVPNEMTLERKNRLRGYSLANCRWATRAEQMKNTKRTRLVRLNGEVKCLKDWALCFGVHVNTVRKRIFVRKWSVRKALTTPTDKRFSREMR